MGEGEKEENEPLYPNFSVLVLAPTTANLGEEKKALAVASVGDILKFGVVELEKKWR